MLPFPPRTRLSIDRALWASVAMLWSCLAPSCPALFPSFPSAVILLPPRLFLSGSDLVTCGLLYAGKA